MGSEFQTLKVLRIGEIVAVSYLGLWIAMYRVFGANRTRVLDVSCWSVDYCPGSV